MQQFCNFVNTISNSLLISWILISFFNSHSIHASQPFHHLIVYKPLSEMNFHNLKSFETTKYNEDLSIIKPVLISESTSPFYLVNRKNLITLEQDKSSNQEINSRLGQDESNREKIGLNSNKSNQNEKQNFFLNTFNENLSENLSKNFLLIKSFNLSSVASSRRVDSKPDRRTRLSENIFKKIGIKLGKLVMRLPKRHNSEKTFANKQDVDRLKIIEHVDTLIDKNSDKFIDETFEDKLKESLKDRTYTALLNRMTVDHEFNRIFKLANFIEKNLQIIGLQPIYQLLSFNRTSDDTFLHNLVKQIDSKLVQNGKFNLLPQSKTLHRRIDNDEESFDHLDNESSEQDDLDGESSTEDNLDSESFDQDSLEYSNLKRTDDNEDLSDIDLLRELEDYIRSRRRLRMQKRMKKVELDDEDEEDYRKSLKWVKSRKRRSRKLNAKKVNARRSKKLSKSFRSDQSNRMNKKRKKNRSKIKKASRDYNLRNYEDETNESTDCNSPNESCEESEIHEQYALPFSSAEDQQMSESYDDQSNRDNDEYGNEYGNDFNGQYNEPAYQPNNQYNEYSKQQDDDNLREQYGRFKSSVKYEGQTNRHSNKYDTYHSSHNRFSNFYPDSNFNQVDGEFNSFTNKQINPYLLTSDYDSSWNEHPFHDLHQIKNLRPKFKKHSFHHLEHHTDHPLLNPFADPVSHHLPGSIPHHLPGPHQLTEFHHSTDHHHHHKDDLTLTKELITKLLIDNKHKIFAILKATKLTHLVFTKKFVAIAAQLFLGKGIYAKKKFILAAYKKCYIKIRTVDMLLIPVGVGTLLTPLFLPLAPLALIIFGIVKLFTCFICFLLAV